MKYKALAIDLDGTLLDGESIPEPNIDALRSARDQGYRIIIATARWKEMALGVAQTIGIEGPVIACSGAQVYDPATSCDVLDLRLPEAFTEELFAMCNDNRCIATITLGADVLLKLDGEPDQDAMGDEMTWVPQLSVSPGNLPRAAAIQGTRINELIRKELKPRWQHEVNILDSVGPTGRIIVMITHKGAHKGTALQAACDHMGLEARQAVAFGDAENDLAMFEIAGAAVAMGQAEDEVRRAATFVSRSNVEAGVAHAVNHLLEHGDFR
ncbi:MAG: HAD family hydrolase [Pseudomonadales bacterium]|nr:HAD family hydrolase [Pseudomonadales bacterium]MDP6470126.1 HAD family hydrolase [Pseudomonadales bacterium]MDP6827031.1 HAD family hydrolase [Pseudomonadales bacterium]MDP6972612.1 HAD family hydrolase [Pseudomonadales bacterium]